MCSYYQPVATGVEFLRRSTKAITPDLPTEEPDNALSMGDEHLSTIPETELDEVIKSSVENLVPILRESEGVFDDTCDVPSCDNSPPLDVLKDHLRFSPILSMILLFLKGSDKFISSSVEDLFPIPSESEDTSGSDSESVLPSCDDFSPIFKEKSVTFSNPLFNSNDDFTSSDDESLSDKDVPEDDSYESNLDESTFLVTPLSDLNEDECVDPGDDIDEMDAFLDFTDIEDGYHDSEGDIHYLESLLSDNITLSLPPKVFLDHDPRSLSND
ncbi:hypothetical protein Tco_0667193 [Tanacetum coccineum]